MSAIQDNPAQTDNIEKTKEALSDVRKAFRLLWAYNKRVFNIVEHIRNRLGFDHYYTDNWLIPNHGGADFCAGWAWDALPLSTIGWLALRPNKDSEENIAPRSGDIYNNPLAGDMLLHILLISDSGFFVAKTGMNKNEPNVLSFAPPDKCQSKLVLSVYVNDIDRNEGMNWLHRIFKPCLNATKWDDPNTGGLAVKGVRRYSAVLMLEDVLDEVTLNEKILWFKQEIETRLVVNLAEMSVQDKNEVGALLAVDI
ncbi:MAG: hypothetical protein HHJ09_00570 [Glaciimonas sp.]|nr:hypothetical protein [Glaciimonas sp.]